MLFREIVPEDNAPLAALVRECLKANGLDIPGTVYYDPELDVLSDFYLGDPEKRFYLVAADEENRAVGGIGLANFPGFRNCAELQKLYLSEFLRGQGTGYLLVKMIEEKAAAMGYEQMYIETHSNLETAIQLYKVRGFQTIEKPPEVVHSTMNRFFLKKL